jgi:hypothetical protein
VLLLLAGVLLAGVLLAGCEHRKPAPVVTIGQGRDATDAGTVAHTHNVQVARYTIRPHTAAAVTVEFGPSKKYGLRTWTVTDPGNQPATILVAGMLGDTTYHMRAVVHFADGTTLDDADHTFRTGHYPKKWIPPMAAQIDGKPQPGVELLNPSIGSWAEAIVTDLHGHVLWAYNYPDRDSVLHVQFHRYLHAAYLTLVNWENWVRHLFGAQVTGRLWDARMWKRLPPERQFATLINPIKPMPNGNFLMVIGLASHALVDSPDGAPPPDTTLVLREINLAGDTVHNLTVAALNRKLRAMGYRGPTLEMMHHDVELLPNGHMIVIANGTRNYQNLPGYPGTTRVIGDVLVDLDPHFHPVWTWSTFDRLDVNRHPVDFPDWTHGNAVVYTKDDGNLIFSMRSQSWVIKIDYRNGRGTGRILWRLGNGGDLRLTNGHSARDWNYGQHEPAIFGARDAGVFDLGMMDNGYGRTLPDGKVCAARNAEPCSTTAPIFRIDEQAKTATVIFRKVFPTQQYSMWGGGVQALANGNMEIDLCNDGRDSDVYEVTRSEDPQTVWHLHAERTNLYRSQRMGSLYPGVQW